MRTLQLDAGRDWRGGQRQALLLSAELAERGVDVTLVTRPGSALQHRAALVSVPVRPLAMRSDLDLRAAWRLARLVRELHPDVLHAHDALSHGIALGARLFGMRVPLVVTRRSLSARQDPFTRFKYRHGVDRYIVISRAVADRLRALGIPEALLRMVPDGLVPPLGGREGRPAVDWRARLGLSADTRVVGTVGALAPEKGQAVLIDALGRLGDAVHGVVVGHGPLDAELRRRARHRGVAGRLHLVGSAVDVQQAIRGFDVYTQPSLAEGLGTAALEAMAQGVPVVASRAGGLAELVSDGETGLLVPVGDGAALADAIRRVLADPALGRRLADHATGAVQGYALDRVAARVLIVYNELVGARPADATMADATTADERAARAAPDGDPVRARRDA